MFETVLHFSSRKTLLYRTFLQNIIEGKINVSISNASALGSPRQVSRKQSRQPAIKNKSRLMEWKSLSQNKVKPLESSEVPRCLRHDTISPSENMLNKIIKQFSSYLFSTWNGNFVNLSLVSRPFDENKDFFRRNFLALSYLTSGQRSVLIRFALSKRQ